MVPFQLVLFFALLFGIPNTNGLPLKEINLLHRQNYSQNLNDGKLILAHVIFRHGDRNGESFYPNDPYKNGEIHWRDGGIGQLTRKGKNQLYELGKYFRRRYGKLLGDKYSPNEVYIRSTDKDRTIMSALVNSAGLFQPTDDEIWNENIPNWQPVSVHTVPVESDYILLFPFNCAKFNSIQDKYNEESPELKAIYTEHANLFSYLSQHSGRNITIINDVFLLYDVLHIERMHNKTLPDWAEKVMIPNGIMEKIAKLQYKLLSDTPELARIRSGFLIREMLEHFTQKINSTLKPDRSLWLYSAHDFTISNFLNSLGLFELHAPPYASSLHFELYETDEHQHYVQLFYRKLGEEILLPIDIPNCGKKCALDQFYAIYDAIIPKNDYEEECRLVAEPKMENKNRIFEKLEKLLQNIKKFHL